MPEPGFDAGLHTAARWRAARRWALLVLGLALFLEAAGAPCLRLSYTEVGDRVQSGQYVGLFGVRRVVAGEFAPTCPLIVLVPLDRSIVSYAAEALGLEK